MPLQLAAAGISEGGGVGADSGAGAGAGTGHALELGQFRLKLRDGSVVVCNIRPPGMAPDNFLRALKLVCTPTGSATHQILLDVGRAMQLAREAGELTPGVEAEFARIATGGMAAA